MSDNNKLFSVIDDALLVNPAHAAVLLAAKSTPSAARKARDRLMQVLPSYIDVEKCFEDRLGWWRGIVCGYSAPVRKLWTFIFPRAL